MPNIGCIYRKHSPNIGYQFFSKYCTNIRYTYGKHFLCIGYSLGHIGLTLVIYLRNIRLILYISYQYQVISGHIMTIFCFAMHFVRTCPKLVANIFSNNVIICIFLEDLAVAEYWLSIDFVL